MEAQNLLDYKGTKYENKIKLDLEAVIRPIIVTIGYSEHYRAEGLTMASWTQEQQCSYTAEYIRTKGDLKSWDSYQLRKLVRVLKDTIMLQYNTCHKDTNRFEFVNPLNPWDRNGELRAKAFLLDAYMQELTNREILRTDVEYATPCQIAAAVGQEY